MHASGGAAAQSALGRGAPPGHRNLKTAMGTIHLQALFERNAPARTVCLHEHSDARLFFTKLELCESRIAFNMDHGLHPPRVWLCMIDSAAEFETFETFAFRVFDVVGPKRDDSHDPQQRALIFDVLFSRGYQLWAKSEDWDLFLL